MGDYPDYTSLMQIIGSDIMVPIDVQAAYIMMPVDIQAQYVTLDIDIVAQSVGNIAIDIAAQSIGNIAVNIAASAITLNVAIQSSAVTLNVNITAQTLTDFKITVNAQNVGVYLQPEWAAKIGVDKNLYGESLTASSGTTYSLVTYTVTAGKTLYISHFGALVDGYNAPISVWIASPNLSTFLAVSGGLVGVFAALNKPLIIAAGVTVYLRATHYASGAAPLRGHIGGYEI